MTKPKTKAPLPEETPEEVAEPETAELAETSQDAPQEAQEAAPRIGGVEEGKDYTVGLWRDAEVFKCGYCPFDTTYPETLREHLRMVHNRPPPPPPAPVPSATLVDRYGNPVMVPAPE